jgi:hypothetical protein
LIYNLILASFSGLIGCFRNARSKVSYLILVPLLISRKEIPHSEMSEANDSSLARSFATKVCSLIYTIVYLLFVLVPSLESADLADLAGVAVDASLPSGLLTHQVDDIRLNSDYLAIYLPTVTIHIFVEDYHFLADISAVGIVCPASSAE